VPLVALVAVAGAWLTWSALLRPQDSTPPVVPPPEAAVAANPGEPVGEPLPFSVAIEAHQELATAAERVARLSQAEPGMGFYLAPILVDSVLYYRVMAGPVRDSAGAATLLQQLLAKGHKTGSTSWDIRVTPLAFLLGVFDSRVEAMHRVVDLAGKRIPAYVLEVPYSSGIARYHLDCGAYAGPAEADVMRKLLGEAGLDANLVERVGRTPS
jgi:hypothetical protein